MRNILLTLSGVLFALCATAQVGEVTTEEIIVEKEKEIILPRADKLYMPVDAPNIQRDSLRLNFQIPGPNFNISPFSPEVKPAVYQLNNEPVGYQNYVKAGYGSYGSPLVSAFVGHNADRFKIGGWFYHESFAKGAVRDAESASGMTRLDVFSDIPLGNWAVRPSVGWQADAFRFFGYGSDDDRISEDANTINRIKLGVKLEETQSNEWSFQLNPVFYSTNLSLAGEGVENAENYFDLSADGAYQFDSTLAAGADFQLGAISFESGSTIQRNFVRVNPWLGFKKDDLYIQAGIELANTNDTLVSGTSSYFYPDISLEWSGLNNWSVFGGVRGYLNPVTYRSLSQQNRFLDDSLTLSHENVKTDFFGGIRGSITPQLSVETGVSVSSVEYLSFMAPSVNDSARFSLLVDEAPVTVFNWNGKINFSPTDLTQIHLRADVYQYGVDTFAEAWHRPEFKLSAGWYQQYSERFNTRLNVVSLGGITAPEPTTFEAITLDPIFDVSLEANYKISDHAGAFVQLQNLLGSEYERYINYPNRSISFRLGGIYRF